MSSIKVNLSNGQSSPVFEKADIIHKNPSIIHFDPKEIIRNITACDAAGQNILVQRI